MNFKLCVYAICKNENKNLERWLSCVKDADLICLCDSSSNKEFLDMLDNVRSGSIFVLNNTNFDINKEGFSYLRNLSLAFATSCIQEYQKKYNDETPWIMLTLDLDEFLEEDGINKIKSCWNSSDKRMSLNGVTILDNGEESVQTVSHKIHSFDEKWKWSRFVHETLVYGDNEETEENTSCSVRYIHEQDLTKKRDYYELLKKEWELENHSDSTTALYLSWEASNHGEMDESKFYAEEAINLILNNEKDSHYFDFEYLCQAYLNIAIYHKLKKNYLDEEINLYKIIARIKTEDMFPFRKVYFQLAECLWNLEEYTESIHTYLECLEITSVPKCWIEDFNLYNDEIIYSKIGTGYYYLYFLGNNNNINDLTLSVQYSGIAHSIDPDNEVYKNNLDLCINALKFELSKSEETKPINKICVYAITKNEGKFVDTWVESMKEADSIVVLDTGSTDDTVEKLRAHGITVVEKIIDPWRFDVARNEALKLVPDDCNILLSTDLDEVLEPGWAQAIRDNWIEGVHERGVYKYSWSHLENGESGRIFRYDKLHSRNWIWKYPVHELLWNTKTESNLYEYDNVLDLFDKMHLHHYPDQSKSRGSYLPLLELRASEDKNDYYGLIYLAHEYYYRGFYEKSIETLDTVLSRFGDTCDLVEKASCYLFKGDSYVALNKLDKSIDNYLKAISIDNTYREPYINIAKVFLDQKEYDIAISYIKTGLKKSYRHFTWLERDISWTYEPYDILALACFYGGYKKDSLVYAVKALSFNPENERLKNNVDLIIKNTDELELL